MIFFDVGDLISYKGTYRETASLKTPKQYQQTQSKPKEKDVGCFTAGATSAKTSLSIAKKENGFLCFQLHCLYTGQ